MRNITILITICLFIVGCAHFSNVTVAQDDMWVAVSFDRGGMNDEISAKLDKSTFNKIVSGKIRSGWIEIEKAYWTKCGKRVLVKDAGEEWGYGNKYIIRIERINRIIPLSDEAIKSLESDEQVIPAATIKPCH